MLNDGMIPKMVIHSNSDRSVARKSALCGTTGPFVSLRGESTNRAMTFGRLRSMGTEVVAVMVGFFGCTAIAETCAAALNKHVQQEYPFMALSGPANVLILPNLAAANIAYKLLEELGDAEMTGPILEGMRHPVQLVAQQDGVRHIVNMATICVADSLRKESVWSQLSPD